MGQNIISPNNTSSLRLPKFSLTNSQATVIVIEHDLDVIRNADYVIDMGPGGGTQGGRIVAAGTPREISGCRESVTGKYL